MTAPWGYGLPTTLNVGGEERQIRTDYRCLLDCFLALTDPDLDPYNKAMEVLAIIYEDDLPPELWKEAMVKAMWFFRAGEDEPTQKGPQLVSWTQDFSLIASPISKTIGQDIRGMRYLHWWSFLSAYMSIGDCLFAQVVAIRDKKARGKPLDKQDREFYRKNRDIIDIKTPLSDAEQELLKEWT